MTAHAGLAPADEAFVARLRAALGRDAVRPAEERFLEEPRGRYRGQAAAVLLPRSPEEVAAVVRLCAEARVGIVPYSGGTGLVGGQLAEAGPMPVLLAFERMARIRDFDPATGLMVAEAGAILADVRALAATEGLAYPLSLASEGSARIGGLLATNAGGVGVLRHGSARDLCLGVEAVLASGEILHGLARVRKDNAGYDLRHLLIGSEGTLGLITAATLRLVPAPAEAACAWAAVPDVGAALRLLGLARAGLGGALSAFELIDTSGLGFLAEVMPEIPRPPAFPAPWVVLLEAEDSAGAAIGSRLEAVLGAALDEALVADVLVAQSEAQRAAFWTVRETIPLANRRIGAIASHDISLPAARLAEFLVATDADVQRLAPGVRVNCFGHLGDGNLHYNLFPPAGGHRGAFDGVRAALTRAVHDRVHAFGGSIAAEHGIGRLKVAELERYADPAALRAMRAIKSVLDPVGILNPGAVLA